jgi:CPA2 family monovalent cation:H+ antiporter-2
MEHELINTIVISIVMALILGLIAQKLRLPTIFGYLVAGVMIGPFTPGYVADASLAKQLAEIGIILLMFGVGLHFSFKDLLDVKKIAFPGAIFQMAVATAIGFTLTVLLGYDWISGLIFGLSLSVASTIVLIRSLEQRSDIETQTGKIAVGWLIVEDIAMVIALVLLPVLADMMAASKEITAQIIFSEILTVALKIGGFVVFMALFGRRFLPPLLVAIAKTKSRELASLGTLAIALGFAFIAYAAFDASFALGAFLAGLVLSESEIGRKSAEQSLPMRDAFAVLFFVSVGMLFDPMTLVEQPVMVLATLLIIVVGKSLAALAITWFFKQTTATSFTIAISLAQIGEFSFILASMAMQKNLLPEDLYNLILAGALLSIAINPFLFIYMDRRIESLNKKAAA